MSEEEKEAITYLKKYIKSDLFYEQEHYNRIEIALNLINKLQKELEHKQETIDKILKELEEFYKKYDIISKDKIKEVLGDIE